MIKITKDGFVWKVLTMTELVKLYDRIDMYVLNDDESESLVACAEELLKFIDERREIGIEVGQINN